MLTFLIGGFALFYPGLGRPLARGTVGLLLRRGSAISAVSGCTFAIPTLCCQSHASCRLVYNRAFCRFLSGFVWEQHETGRAKLWHSAAS